MNKLLEALDYENEQVVIKAFTDRYNISHTEAQEIFTETKKWLWLAANTHSSNDKGVFIDEPLMIIDEMWHNFILHTKQYYEFCMTKFKRIIHHVPTPKLQQQKLKKLSHSSYETLIKDQYQLIYDHLGPETLVKWYDTFANKYTREYIRSVKKQDT